MDDLKRLIFLLEKRTPKTINNYIDLSQNSLESRLYFLIKEKKIQDNEDAINSLYGNTTDAKKFKMLKSRLKKKLYAVVDTIVLNDSLLKPYVHEEQQCLTLINRAYILYQSGEKVLALKVIAQAVAIANEYRIISLILRCYEMKYVILFAQGDFNAFKECEKDLEYFSKLNSIELEAKKIFHNSRFALKQGVSGRKEYLDQMPDALNNLEQKWEDSKNPKIFEYLHILRIQYHELKGEYEQIIQCAGNADKLIEDGVIPKKRLEQRFNKYITLFAFLQLRKYDEGIAFARSLENTFLYGSNNWASYMENYFQLALQSQDYVLAASLLDKFSVSGAFQNINNSAKERWVLNIAFYNLMTDKNLSSDAILGEDAQVILRQNVKDKEGFNVAIIILNFFEMLKQDKVEEISLYNDRIRKYISKYLSKKEASRPRLFLKLLLLILRNNLDVAACKTKGKYLLQKLKSTPLPGSAFAEVEIVPYEQLWDLALHTIENVNQKAYHS